MADVAMLKILYGLDLESCEKGTRIAIIDSITRWADSSDSTQQIFWLCDVPGTGKTTLAVTMARRWLREGRLAGRFFFTPNTRKVDGVDIVEVFCPTVAKDMAELQPTLRPFIDAAIQSTSSLHFSLETQFERLIIAPLKKATSPLFLVFDALDNCEEGDETRIRDKLIESIIKVIPTAPNIRLLITSRPLPDISHQLERSPLIHGRDLRLLETQNNAKLDDIRIFIKKRLPRHTEKQRELVTMLSDGLFIWAATACKLLRATRQPESVLERLVAEKAEGSLDPLYMEVLKQALINNDASDHMLKVLQVVINAYEPVSISTIQLLLPDNEHIKDFVQHLGSVLKGGDPHRPIRVLHPTFREFIQKSTIPNGFVINPLESHGVVALGCLNLLGAFLKYDLLDQVRAYRVIPRNSDISNLTALLDRQLSPALRYASSYWPYHAATAAMFNNSKDVQILRNFIETKLLNWIELMSLRGQLSICIEGLCRLLLGLDSWIDENKTDDGVS